MREGVFAVVELGVKGTVGVPGTGISCSETVGPAQLSTADQVRSASAGVGIGTLLAAGIVLVFIFLWAFG